MAKLIKLSTTTDQNRTGNSFNCLSDEDIMIEANSKISLLNCQISSGILKDYVINGTDILPGTNPPVSGEFWGYLDLVAPSTTTFDPNRRRLFLRNGNYNITTLCAEIKKSILDALVSTSAGGYASTTGNTLPMPLYSPDFELAVDVFVNKENKIEIDYNSKPILTTLTYGNIKPGIQVDGNGNVSYNSTGGLPTELPIDPARSTGTFQAATVYTQGSVAGKFAVGDAITLMAYNFPEVAPCAYNVVGITIDEINLDSAVDLDNTLADQTNLTVYTVAGAIPVGIKAGDDVCIDDGTSTDGAPSANLAKGTVASVDVQYVNENYEISALPKIPFALFDTAFDIQPQAIQPGASPTLFTFDIDCDPATDIVDRYALFTVGNNTSPGYDKTIAVCVVMSQKAAADPTKSTVSLSLTALQGQPLTQINNITKYGGEIRIISEFLSKAVAPDFGDIEDFMPKNAKYWVCVEPGGIPIFRVQVEDIVGTTDTEAVSVYLDYTQPFIAEVWDNKTVLQGIQAFAYIISQYGTDWKDFYLTPAYVLKSANELDPTTITIADGSVVSLTENGIDFLIGSAYGSGDIKVELASTELLEIGGQDFTQFNLTIDYADASLEYLNNNLVIANLQGGATSNYQIFKANNLEQLKIVFATIDNPAKIPLATRIWEGIGIEALYKVELTRLGAITKGWDLTKFSEMVKGDYSSKYGDAYAFALCDEVCNQGPGRAVFLVSALPTATSGADVGLIKIDGNSFANMDVSQAELRLRINKSRSGNQRYELFVNASRVPLGAGSEVVAQVGDRIVIQWNTCFGYTYDPVAKKSRGDRQFITKPASLNQAKAMPGVYLAPTPDEPNGIDAPTRELMRNNVSFAVMRAQSLDYQYIGAPVGNDSAGNWAGSTYPYTPLDNPTQRPIKWDTSATYAPFIRPGAGGQIRMLELVGSGLTLTDANGVKTPFDGTNYINHPDYHTPDLEIASNNATKYTDPANAFQLVFANLRLQKLLGFSEASYFVNGASGSITANKTYLEAYLPENILVMLDTAPSISTYDCGQTQGKRRQIVCCAVNTQSITGDINIEPANLYRINLGNKTPINSRKFTVSFETFYGEQIILANAKATVNLLVEPPE